MQSMHLKFKQILGVSYFFFSIFQVFKLSWFCDINQGFKKVFVCSRKCTIQKMYSVQNSSRSEGKNVKNFIP